MTIAIDGPAGAGKSTISDALAKELGILHLDSGALFRALALKVIRMENDTKNEECVLKSITGCCLDVKILNGVQHTLLDGEDVSQEIRTQRVGQGASDLGVHRIVREFVTQRVREISQGISMVVDGRDIGSVMLPQADYKFFLTATAEERAMRRMKQLESAQSNHLEYSTILQEIEQRDLQDSTRSIAPLCKAPDAIEIDSTNMSIEEVVSRMKGYIKDR